MTDDSPALPRWTGPEPELGRLWRGALWLAGGCAALLLGTLALLLPIAARPWLALPAGVLLVAWLLGRVLLERALQRHAHALLDDGVLLRRGAWWQREVFVPRPRIQHTDVVQGPLARRLDLATLVLHTSGARLGQLEIPGLRPAAARALRDALLQRTSPVTPDAS